VGGGVMVLVVLALALFWPSTVTAPEEAIDSIAVLPFENASNDPDLEYLSDGIADSIISSLSQIADLKVMSSSAVRRYKGATVDAQVVADELGVRAVLVGRVLQSGAALSINVELVDTQDNTQLWGEQYERELAEILDVKREIAKEISEKLRLQLSGEEQSQLAKQGTENPEAYQDYLRGRYHWERRTPESFQLAIDYFNEAIDKDPNYAHAYTGLADTYFLQAVYSGRSVNEFYELELGAAEKALELDDTLAEAHASMGSIKGMHEWDWSTGEEHFRRAIELNPNYFRAHQTYANVLVAQGRLDEAWEEIQRAQTLDPASLQLNDEIGRWLMFKDRYDEAIEHLEGLMERGSWTLIWAYWAKGNYEMAVETAERDYPEISSVLRHVFSGNRLEAETSILGLTTTFQPRTIAMLYAVLGDKDQAIEWLSKAVDEHYHNAIWIKVFPTYAPLRDDPRFQDLLRRMNLEP